MTVRMGLLTGTLRSLQTVQSTAQVSANQRLSRRLWRRTGVALAALLVTATVSAADLAPPALYAAERHLNLGEADLALAASQSVTRVDPHNGAAQFVLCRTFYLLDQADPAIGACEAAAASLNSSAAYDWLGRAYGLKAGKVGPFAAMGYARRVRTAFETAVRLDPHDGAALNDLSEFYVQAPGIVGGGVTRARDLADRSAAALPQNANRIRALAAEKNGDYGTAEREFRAAAAGNQPTAWADLADFYARRKQTDRALDALQHAVASDHAADSVLVDCAEIMVNSVHTHPELAEQWFRAYLNGRSQSEAAPVFRVRTELAQLLLSRGDKAAARSELSRALALASAYEPAKKALRSL